MATTIINPPSHTCPVITSSLYSIKASSDQLKILVELVRDPQGDKDCFYSTYLYPYKGVAELTDVGSIIEEHFRELDKIWDVVEIRFDDASASFTAGYCMWNLDAGFNFSKVFLTAAKASVVHRNSAISLAHLDDGSNEYVARFVGHDASGNTKVTQRSFSRSAASNHVSFSVNEILQYALTASGDEPVLDSVGYFTISHGSMQKAFYVVDHPFFLTFAFRNIFNAYEYVDVVATVTRKTQVDCGNVTCEHTAMQYDRRVERSYDVSTGPLTDEQVRELEQLICSHSIKLCASGHDYDVIITDHTVEVDNNNEALSTIKFTFRFTSDRPLIVTSDLGALTPDYPRIFSQVFSAVFE